ncbi:MULTISPECIES: hypothetical protein [unclassified Streptomyces]|uniref:hypothetical protein n=1 Tax=unclassified Streptomyces TaxID=2593676 RepID=UPI0038162083
MRAVYAAQASLITQVEDGLVRPEDGLAKEAFTSAASCPAVLVDMLHHLDPGPDDMALEIGTGSGYSTALLAQRVRPENLVTMELNTELPDLAGEKLAGLGKPIKTLQLWDSPGQLKGIT